VANRYFGSKEQVFDEVVERTMTQGDLIADRIIARPDSGRTGRRGRVDTSHAT